MRYVLSLLLLLSFVAVGQKYSFVRYSTEQGLPQSQVTAITQDEQGYLWIGTIGGLSKFGGQKFITFSAKDGLLNNRITSLSYFEKTLWIGHDGGISFIYNGKIKNIAFEGDGNDRSRNVSSILRYKDKILVFSNGGGLFEYKDNHLIKVPLPDTDYERIREAYVYDNQLYMATKKGILITTDVKNFTQLDEFGDETYSGITGIDQTMIISSYNVGIYVKDMTTGKVRHYDQEKLKHRILGSYVDREGKIWMHTLNGVVQIDENKKINFYNDANGLPVNMISCFFHDNAGNVWIGSQGKGMFRFPNADFRYFDQSTGLPSDLFLTGFQTNNGDYYLGSYDKGIVIKTKNGKYRTIELERTIWASLPDIDGKHWFGTGRSLISIDPMGKTTVYTSDSEPNLPGTKITTLYKVGPNSMYIGGNGGVALYENGTFINIGGEKEIGTVRDFEILNDSLYCATNLGLLVLRKGEFQLVEGSHQLIYNLELDDNGALWYGTEEGLYRMSNGLIEQIQLKDDPASNNILFMNHRKGKLFLGTNNGLFVLSGLSKDQPIVKRYGTGDGIIDLETNLNSGFFDRRGDFWFGTASGLVSYHMSGERKKMHSPNPNVNLQRILLNYNTFDYSRYSKDLGEDGFPNSLVLPYSKNNLIFELDGVSLVHQKPLQYQYWLEGLRDSWSDLSDNSTITFTNLPAGNYELHARSVDIDGRVSEEVNFTFTIKAAFYRTWWFIVLCALFLSGILILFFRFRLKRLGELSEKEKLDYQTKLLRLEQKSMNASMNRHFIFNSLNSIQYFINTQDRVSANKYLTNFANLIRKNLDSVTAEGNMISLEEELERIQLYLSLESMRFKDRFEYEINVHDVDIEAVKIPPMMMQPFIENSIIHGILPNEDKKGLITIDIDTDDEHLIITIEDNGIGINKSMSRKSPQDGDHRSQGMEITSKRIELIQKMSKNDISLEGPEEIKDENRLINGTRVLIKIPLSNLDI